MQALQTRIGQIPDVVVLESGPDLPPATKAPTIHTRQPIQRVAPNCRRPSERLHEIYPNTPPEAAKQARELLGLIVASDRRAAGAWVMARDLARFYREHWKAQGLPRLPWVAIARHLKYLAPKRLIKRNGRRRVCYHMPQSPLVGSRQEGSRS
jgi:hypothetical protein